MGSIIAGSTYLFAPPPPKSYVQNPLIAHLLCHPSAQSRLLLQLQRKDLDARHAFPQFDLVAKKAGRRRRASSSYSAGSSASSHVTPPRHPRQVAVQHSETGEKVATIKYADSLTTSQKRKAGIATDDVSAIAVIEWEYTHSITKTWTVHRYESKRKGYKSGYEFRMRSSRVRESPDGSDGFVTLRWSTKLRSESPAMHERPASLSVPSRSSRRRSSSVSSGVSDAPRRRHTFPAAPTPRTPLSVDPKWEFTCSNAKRMMASMTPQRLHIHSISSTSSNVSSPSTSSFDDDCPTDRELTPGKMFQLLVVTALFVGLEENFASKLHREFFSLTGLRTPAPDDPPLVTGQPDSTRHRVVDDIPERSSQESPPSPLPLSAPSPAPIRAARKAQVVEPEELLMQRTPNIDPVTTVTSTSYAAGGWNYLSSTAAACLTKVINLAT